MKITALILAAGKGTRMKSSLPKVMHGLCGKTLIEHVIDTCKKAGISDIVVVGGHEHELIKKHIMSKYKDIKFVLQKPQKGTGHAVFAVLKKKIPLNKGVLILNGDVPLIEPKTIKALIKSFTQKKPGGIIGISKIENPYGYGRIIVNSRGSIKRITEEKDASAPEKKINIVNSGVYVILKEHLKRFIPRIKMNEKKGEYYLTDIVGLMADAGEEIKGVLIDKQEFSGINDMAQLAEAASIKNRKNLEKTAQSGVVIEDFATVFIDGAVKIGKGTVIRPFTVIKGKAVIGKNCVIGPSAHIRPGTIIGDKCRIGNYVEVKNSKIGNNTNVSHLSYIGDAELGSAVNIGAGTITANYDGVKKHKTVIGSGAHIGSNTVLVAPVKVGAGAVVGAGSVITDDVPAGSLAIARGRQVIKKKRAAKRRNKK